MADMNLAKMVDDLFQQAVETMQTALTLKKELATRSTQAAATTTAPTKRKYTFKNTAKPKFSDEQRKKQSLALKKYWAKKRSIENKMVTMK